MDGLEAKLKYFTARPNTSYTVTLMASEEAPLMLNLKSLLVGLGYALTSNRFDATAAGLLVIAFSKTADTATVVAVATVAVPVSVEGVSGVVLDKLEPTDVVDGKDTHPALFLAVMVYQPDANPLNTPVRLVKPELLMLKLLPNTVEVTFIVPVTTVAVGWVTDKVGAAGVAGCAFTTTLLAVDMQPPELMATRL